MRTRLAYADLLRRRDRPGDGTHAERLADEASADAVWLGIVTIPSRAGLRS